MLNRITECTIKFNKMIINPKTWTIFCIHDIYLTFIIQKHVFSNWLKTRLCRHGYDSTMLNVRLLLEKFSFFRIFDSYFPGELMSKFRNDLIDKKNFLLIKIQFYEVVIVDSSDSFDIKWINFMTRENLFYQLKNT